MISIYHKSDITPTNYQHVKSRTLTISTWIINKTKADRCKWQMMSKWLKRHHHHVWRLSSPHTPGSILSNPALRLTKIKSTYKMPFREDSSFCSAVLNCTNMSHENVLFSKNPGHVRKCKDCFTAYVHMHLGTDGCTQDEMLVGDCFAATH